VRGGEVAMVAPKEGTLQALAYFIVPSELPSGIDPDAAFIVCVRFGQYTAKLDDGSSVHVPSKYAEWVVDYRQCTLESLEKDFAARVKWGRCQQVVVYGYDKRTGKETKFLDNMDLAHALFDWKRERRLILFVDVEDKSGQLVTSSSISEVNELVMGEVVTAKQGDALDSSNQHLIDWDSFKISPILEEQIGSSVPMMKEDEMSIPQEQVPQHVIDWDGLEIAPIPEEQIGSSLPVMEEDEMYDFLGLRTEDERADQARLEAEKQRDSAPGPAPRLAQRDLNLDEAEIDARFEAEIFYDRDDPPMIVGSSYGSMVEFRSAVRQHAIKGQFELGTEKSDPERFRGYCKAEGCPWAIVARLMPDGKSVKVTLNRFAHACTSIEGVKTKMVSYKWVAEKAIPFLKKDPNMGAKKLKEELETKYNVTVGYSKVWQGRQKAVEQIFGSWEESYLFNFKAEVELKMPGSVVEIDVQEDDDGIYFCRFFCAFKPCIDGFMNGCRPYLSIDSTAFNGKWNGHLPFVTSIDGHNWMFPVAFGFFQSETTDNWTWFMQQLHKAIGKPSHLAISSEACKGLENAVKSVFPWAEHRECFCHLMQNFVEKFPGPMYGNMYPAARSYMQDRFEHYMNIIHETNSDVKPYLETYHKLLWMRSKFSEEIKCDFISNNLADLWNKWIKDMKDLPVAELADAIRSKIMDLLARRKKIGEKLDGEMLPIIVRQLNAMTRSLGHLRVVQGDRDQAEVAEITPEHEIIRHRVNLAKHTCTCREWQVSGKPCPHALALIISTRNPRMADYLDPCYSVQKYKLAYAGVIHPLSDKSQWPKVNLGFNLLPPLTKKDVEKQRKNMIVGCLDKEQGKLRTKGKWQVQCKSCLGMGHRATSPKCPLNSQKIMKNSDKQGRPLGSTSCAAGASTPKRQKVSRNDSSNASPGPVSERQLALTKAAGEDNFYCA
jgi:hypothetical protein